MGVTRTLLVATAVLGIAACTGDPAQTGEPDNVRGAELLTPFKQELQQALVAGMQQGPINAISVCRDQAPAIAAAHSADGVRMGRTSNRLRNSANVAPDWVEPVLAAYLAGGADLSPTAVVLPGQRTGYVEPIEVKPLCLACHGKDLGQEVAAHIAAAYPDDAATGYEVGDVRGVFWVEYDD